jgi:hypothetical protein
VAKTAAVKLDDQVSHRVKRQARVDDQDDGVSAEAALKLANETIAAQNKTIANVTKQAKDASTAAANATVGRISDREQTINSALSAAEMARKTADTAWRAAKQAGDIDAEAEALDMLAEAKLEIKTWTSEKQKFDAQKPQLLEQAKNTAAGPANDPENDARSAQWISDHPKFNTDAKYKQRALDLHAAAIARGLVGGSPGYINYLDDGLTELYGEDHGKMTNDSGGGSRTSRAADTRVDRGTSAGAPPSRDSDRGSFSAHGVRLIRNSDGSKSVQGEPPAEWVDGAKWTGMSLPEYCVSMLELEEEKQAGRGQVVQMGDGVIYR